MRQQEEREEDHETTRPDSLGNEQTTVAIKDLVNHLTIILFVKQALGLFLRREEYIIIATIYYLPLTLILCSLVVHDLMLTLILVTSTTGSAF